MGWMVHRVPSQCSASDTKSPELFWEPPAATHAEGEVHDTAFRKLNCAPGGLGVAWMRQVVPFQCSAKVTSVPELVP